MTDIYFRASVETGNWLRVYNYRDNSRIPFTQKPKH